MVLYGGKATKRNTVFKNKTSINTSNINNIIPSNSGRPSPVNQHTSDWRLKDIIPSFETPKAYADEVSTPVEPVPEVTKEYDNWYNKRSANAVTADNTDTSNMSVFDENNPDHIKNSGTKGESGGLFGGYFDHLFTSYDDPSHPNNYKEMEAAAELDKQDDSLPNITPPDIATNFHADGLPIDEMPRSDLQGQGFFHNIITDKKAVATAKEGHELFDIPDYVNNEVRSSYYGLGMDVNPEAHTKAINKQQLRKFENSLQKDWSTLVRNNTVDDVTYLNLQMRIGEANISAAEKQRLIGVFQKKKNKLQGTSVSSPRNPNKAEQLKIKIDSGDFTSKEWDQYQTLTGNPVLYSGNKSIITRADGTFKPKVLTYKDLF